MDIEKAMGMRQPEVSLSMKELRDRGWVAKRDVKKEGKGRPLHAYRLARPFAKIVDEIVEEERRRLQAAGETLDRLQRQARAF